MYTDSEYVKTLTDQRGFQMLHKAATHIIFLLTTVSCAHV